MIVVKKGNKATRQREKGIKATRHKGIKEYSCKPEERQQGNEATRHKGIQQQAISYKL